VTASFAGRQHAHEEAVGTFSVEADHLLLKCFGMREDDDRRRFGGARS